MVCNNFKRLSANIRTIVLNTKNYCKAFEVSSAVSRLGSRKSSGSKSNRNFLDAKVGLTNILEKVSRNAIGAGIADNFEGKVKIREVQNLRRSDKGLELLKKLLLFRRPAPS